MKSKPVLGLLAGGLLGLLDGLSTRIAAPEMADYVFIITVFSTLKGLVTGLLIGVFADKVDSLPLGMLFGLSVGLVLSFIAAALPSPTGEHAYFHIMLPGGILGLLVGYVTQRYGSSRRSSVHLLCLFGGASLVVPGGAGAQPADASFTRLTEEVEIALARSAAPEAVSAEATIWVARDGGFEVAVEGENGNHCFVQRSLPLSVEPICYDPEAAATIMKWEFRHFELRTGGATKEELERALAEEVGSGEIPLPQRPAMSYMMSAAQRFFDPGSGQDLGSWKPHIMLYVPYLTNETIGMPRALPMMQVAQTGTPLAHLVVVVPEFVEPGAP